jgi:hypothetical protein
MTTITISIDDNNVNITAPENASNENDVKAAQILQLLDELKENVKQYIPEPICGAAFGAVEEEICNIMKG